MSMVNYTENLQRFECSVVGEDLRRCSRSLFFLVFLFLILQICLQVHINAQNILLFHINSLSDALELESLGDLLYTTMIDKICLALQTNWFTKQENRQTHILLRKNLRTLLVRDFLLKLDSEHLGRHSKG